MWVQFPVFSFYKKGSQFECFHATKSSYIQQAYSEYIEKSAKRLLTQSIDANVSALYNYTEIVY